MNDAEIQRGMERDAARIRAATGVRLSLAAEPYYHAKVGVMLTNDLKRLADWCEARSALTQVPAQIDGMIERLTRLRETLNPEAPHE